MKKIMALAMLVCLGSVVAEASMGKGEQTHSLGVTVGNETLYVDKTREIVDIRDKALSSNPLSCLLVEGSHLRVLGIYNSRLLVVIDKASEKNIYGKCEKNTSFWMRSQDWINNLRVLWTNKGKKKLDAEKWAIERLDSLGIGSPSK